jgi:transcriptional regulator with XRE-family HTH domain
MLLRDLRKAAGMSGEAAARELEWAQSKVSKIEAGRQSITAAELRGLLALYGASERNQLRALKLRDEAREVSLWQELGVDLGSYVDFESSARRIRSNDPLMIPGLLQTERYAEAVIRALGPSLTAEERAQRLKVRAERAELLRGIQPPELWSVISEEALRRRVGSSDVMVEQVAHIADLADEMGHVTVQVLPLTAGAHAGLDGSYAVLDFEQPDPPIVYTETAGGAAWLERPEEVSHVEMMFNHVCASALRPADSIEVVRRIAEEHEHA